MHIINTSIDLIYLLILKPDRCVDQIVLKSEVFTNDNKFVIRLKEKVKKVDGYTTNYTYFSFTQNQVEIIFDGSSLY